MPLHVARKVDARALNKITPVVMKRTSTWPGLRPGDLSHKSHDSERGAVERSDSGRFWRHVGRLRRHAPLFIDLIDTRRLLTRSLASVGVVW